MLIYIPPPPLGPWVQHIPEKAVAGLGPLEPAAVRVDAEADFIRLNELPAPLPADNR